MGWGGVEGVERGGWRGGVPERVNTVWGATLVIRLSRRGVEGWREGWVEGVRGSRLGGVGEGGTESGAGSGWLVVEGSGWRGDKPAW